jgi:prephenate dehydratase
VQNANAALPIPPEAAAEPLVVYPGREGAHAAAAAEALYPAGELVPLPSFAAVAEAVQRDEAAFGVLPIESSLAGPVAETHDILYASSLSIVAETALPIRHCLVAPESVPVERLRVIHSHPVALDQCRLLLARLPEATAVAAATTADAARDVALRGDPTEAAIASERAAALYGLVVLDRDVGDRRHAFTRFVAVAPYTRLDRTDRAFRIAFSFVTDHRPGALHRAIEPLAQRGLDLVQLVSRPLPDSPWRYRFDAVLTGHPLDPSVQAALRQLAAATRSLHVFGAYPAG